jgi:hypothetical protein
MGELAWAGVVPEDHAALVRWQRQTGESETFLRLHEQQFAAACPEAIDAGVPVVDRDRMQEEIERHSVSWHACYRGFLYRFAGEGRLTATARVCGDGRIGGAYISSSEVQDPGLQRCILEVLLRIRFAPVPGGGPVQTELPFIFQSVADLPPGLIEGERLTVVSRSAGMATPQDLSWVDGMPFSGNAHFFWREARPGDVLRAQFLSEVEGNRTLILKLTRAPDSGVVRLRVNGKLLGEFDSYSPRVEPAPDAAFENVPLAKGPNVLEVEIIGTNPEASPKNYMFGLDYLRTL